MDLVERIAESNRIEGIERPPTREEIEEHSRFVGLAAVMVIDLVTFVKIYRPNAELRSRRAMNVFVGSYTAPPGGPLIRRALNVLLDLCNAGAVSAWEAHVQYESIHPFTDGNGRSGRALWYWMQQRFGPERMVRYGFLRAFYYRTLHREQAGTAGFHPLIARALRVT